MKLLDKINPKHTALLVIDIQNDFVNPKGKLAIEGRQMDLINKLMEKLPDFIKAAEKHNVLTLYTQQIYDYSKLNNLQKEQYDIDGKFISCDVNTDGWHFYKINPKKQDVYVKHNMNAFSNNDLEDRLKENQIKTLIIVGVDTFYCVETAIRNGFDLGYKIVVPADLIGANAKHLDRHQNTLTHVRKNYGVLSSSEEIINIWDSHRK